MDESKSGNPLGASIKSHSGTLALKAENFSKKSVVLVKCENGFTKTLFSLFSRVVCPGDGFSKSIFAFY